MPSTAVLSVEQRILEAAVLLPSHGAVTGWAGLCWLGAGRWFDGNHAGELPTPVWLATGGEDVRSQRGIAVSAERLDPRDVVVVDGIRVTTAVRSACFAMRQSFDARSAARILSMSAYHDLVSISDMVEYVGRHPGWTGVPRCRAALDLAEENCWSPTELDTVLAWRLDADLPRPLCNRPVFDRAGNHLGTPDLLDPVAGVVGEYDGAVHLSGAMRSSDVGREERFRRAGLEYFTVLSTHLRQRDALAERMRAVRARARWEGETTRAWTIDPPPWWPPTHTVDLRRDLTPVQRRHALRYRAA